MFAMQIIHLFVVIITWSMYIKSIIIIIILISVEVDSLPVYAIESYNSTEKKIEHSTLPLLINEIMNPYNLKSPHSYVHTSLSCYCHICFYSWAVNDEDSFDMLFERNQWSYYLYRKRKYIWRSNKCSLFENCIHCHEPNYKVEKQTETNNESNRHKRKRSISIEVWTCKERRNRFHFISPFDYQTSI